MFGEFTPLTTVGGSHKDHIVVNTVQKGGMASNRA
jgi:hypothetical protein